MLDRTAFPQLAVETSRCADASPQSDTELLPLPSRRADLWAGCDAWLPSGPPWSSGEAAEPLTPACAMPSPPRPPSAVRVTLGSRLALPMDVRDDDATRAARTVTSPSATFAACTRAAAPATPARALNATAPVARAATSEPTGFARRPVLTPEERKARKRSRNVASAARSRARQKQKVEDLVAANTALTARCIALEAQLAMFTEGNG